MAKKPGRLKAAAQLYVPQTKEEVIADIKTIGDLQRDLTRVEAAMNDAIGAITDQHSGRIEELKKRLQSLQKGVQSWCEAHRAELTNNGKVKSANLITGEVQWRIRPPSVTVRGVDAVLDALKRLGLNRFIRPKEEINKEAMLNEPDAVRGVAGITINSGIEDFAIVPFEQEVR
ncbi:MULTISPECIES: host-nuclease inhibitor Gam family protein [unclassified Pseudomonas]|uniref:host-nuclease inhibitor Gam family protein n=1 Tax=unclassified Pseudomonas TaxID=196821 RepID=UPI002449ADDE|nr:MULTISPECIES: host-nuclease inhibitor Gam family protein [unclassified Pseudomonas]MDH0894390.1 host-nuclease inhibitor Gam family protein [Pseudomonas sp. GD03875]MDH1063315.1 host-nuclease inhibitor Gam family protein [Pseudomonas sp. GD03985]